MVRVAILAGLVLAALSCHGRGASPTNDEQYMLQLVNRMRTNPAAELEILTNINGTTWLSPKSDYADVASALNYFKVSAPALVAQWSTLAAVAPLAWNSTLNGTAAAHNQAMIAAGTQSHQEPGEPDFGTRFTNAGYNYSEAAENVYAYASSVIYAHAGFAIDWGSTATGLQSPAGHRDNLMDAGLKELGISIVAGSNSLGPLVVTQDFGSRSGNAFLTGVVFKDSVTHDNFYTPGEGLANVTVQAFAHGTLTLMGMTTTWSSGGYELQLANGTYDIRFIQNATIYTQNSVLIANQQNVEVDWIPVPEPSTGALAACGLMLWPRRRRALSRPI